MNGKRSLSQLSTNGSKEFFQTSLSRTTETLSSELEAGSSTPSQLSAPSHLPKTPVSTISTTYPSLGNASPQRHSTIAPCAVSMAATTDRGLRFFPVAQIVEIYDRKRRRLWIWTGGPIGWRRACCCRRTGKSLSQ